MRSWTAVLVILCAALVALGAYHLRALPSGGGAAERRSLREGLSGLKEVIAAFFTKRHIWYYIAFIILYRQGLRRTLFSLCCVFNLPFAVYALLAWFQPSSMWLVGGGIVVEYFGYGFGFVGLTLFMMQQVAPGRHQMAHYAFASGIMNLSVMLTGMASGFLSDMLSYKFFFVAVMLATVPAFVITKLVPFTYDDKPNDK